MDIGVLMMLFDCELVVGVVEVIKIGVIVDVEFFDWIEVNVEVLNCCEFVVFVYVVKCLCEIKVSVVVVDECEGGLCVILNFGYMFGYVIEVGFGYGEWLYGEVVGCGMVMVGDLLVWFGFFDEVLW